MSVLDMNGPFLLNSETIDDHVIKNRCGNYALGHGVHKGRFAVMYTGRSDKDLNGRLKDYIDKPYTTFKFSYADSADAAYGEECRNFHYYKDSGYTLDNEIHPDKPEGSGVKCPVCGK
jgi:hypothetical protein